MPVQHRKIDKFGATPVIINDDHPLALAQNKIDAGRKQVPGKPGGPDYGRMNAEALKAEAAAVGLTLEPNATKKEIIAALEARDEAAQKAGAAQ